jgi:hypothetical protein
MRLEITLVTAHEDAAGNADGSYDPGFAGSTDAGNAGNNASSIDAPGTEAINPNLCLFDVGSTGAASNRVVASGTSLLRAQVNKWNQQGLIVPPLLYWYSRVK